MGCSRNVSWVFVNIIVVLNMNNNDNDKSFVEFGKESL